jgi:hypothetical protein
VIECEPTARVEVANVAVSGFNPLSVPVPIVVAVNVTELPYVEGVPDVATAVVVLAWFTVCVTVFDGLAAKLAVPA